MPTLRELQAVIEDLWPAAGAESWDAVGLVAGDPGQAIEHVHLAVDAVPATAHEAVDLGADLLLTHHPLLLRGVTTIAESTYKGSVLTTLVRGGTALVAAHTNADVVTTGTSAVLADRLGLTDQSPLEPGRTPRRASVASARWPNRPPSERSPGRSSTSSQGPPRGSGSPVTSTSRSARSRSAPARATLTSATPPCSARTSTSRAISGTTRRPSSASRRCSAAGRR
ncbi:hypothetical protein GCM10017714_10200 [Curtobacterium pusillum]